MADVKGKEVESYKITPEMRDILKRYRRVKRVESVLRLGTEIEKKKLNTMRDLWESLQGEMTEIQRGMPKETLRELEGMQFPERESLTKEQTQIRY